MPKPKTWLLAAAALTLTAGAAFADPLADARRQAAEDSAKAAGSARDATTGSSVHIYRHGDDMTVTTGRGGRTGYFADLLQLRSEQIPALETFLAATRNRSDRTERPERRTRFDDDAGQTTPQRLEEMEARLAAQQAEADRKIAAIKTFYGQLDDGQRRIFDGMPLLMVPGPTFGPMVIPVGQPMPPRPPRPPEPPRL